MKQDKSSFNEVYISLIQNFECALTNKMSLGELEFFLHRTIKEVDVIIYRAFDNYFTGYEGLSSNVFYVDREATLNKLQEAYNAYCEDENKVLTIARFKGWLCEQCFYYEPEDEDLCSPKCYIDDFKKCEFIVFYTGE